MVVKYRSLTEMIELVEVAPAVFEGNPTRFQLPRVFGGQVVAMAMEAATRTLNVPWTAHSVQCQFLRPGDADHPIRFEVTETRTGGSFTTRHVEAFQGERQLFSARVSYHRNEEGGFGHQFRAPQAPPPESLPSAAELARDIPDEWPQFYTEWDNLDIRVAPIDASTPPSSTGRPAHVQVWIRAVRPVPSPSQNIHNALLAGIADLTFLSTSLVPHGIAPKHPGVQMASLDHCVWFHRPFRIDEWLLYDQVSPSAHGGLGLCRGEFYTSDGVHVASVVQEGLIRPV